MAVEVSVTGVGGYHGAKSNITGYSSVEESTPIDPSDSSGGTGVLTFSAVEDPATRGSVLLLNNNVTLTDGIRGLTSGTVNSVAVDDGLLRASADSRINQLVMETQVAPFIGTLSDAFSYYMSLAGINSNVFVDPSIASRQVRYQGFSGNLWTHLKEICTVQQVEISLVSNNIVLRPIRQFIANTTSSVTRSWSVGNGDISQFVDVNYYNNASRTDTLVYPDGGWNEGMMNPTGFQVGPSERVFYDIPINASLTSVQQPVPADHVDIDYTGSSVYAVVGKDGKPVSALDWTAGGGSVSVFILEDTTTLRVRIVGSGSGSRGPFRISTRGTGDQYFNSLRIVGTGVFFNKQTIRIPTGAPAAKTATLVGATIDNTKISSLAQAYNVGSIAAGHWSGSVQEISGTTTVMNRPNDDGAIVYPTFAFFNSTWPNPNTFANFDTAWSGNTFANFTAYYFSIVERDFDNQIFGNINGARVPYRDSMYRIRSATVTEGDIQWSAERDATFGDFSDVWNGSETFATFDTYATGLRFDDFALISLGRA